MTDTADLMQAVRQGRVRVDSDTEAIALILHGGRAKVDQPLRWRDASYLRMLPFAPAVRRASDGRVATALVHNSHGGWVASSGSGLVQAREVVRALSDEHGLPVVVLGHSSGGWAALRIGDEEAVIGSVALAPWLGDSERTEPLQDKVIRVIHGEGDRICSPTKSANFVRRLQSAGADAEFRGVPGGHAMLDNPRRWHALAAQAVIEVVDRSGFGHDAS